MRIFWTIKRPLTTFSPSLQTKEALTLAAYDVAKQAALENVVYTEVLPYQSVLDQGLTVPETIDAVCDGLRQAQEEFGIVAKALVCGMRQSDQNSSYPCRSKPS